MSDLKDKIARLPAWAREHIRRLEVQADPNNGELAAMRRRTEAAEKTAQRLRDRVDAMMDLFQAAGRGGHETARTYVDRVIAEYTTVEEEGFPPPGCLCPTANQLRAHCPVHGASNKESAS